jgi:translocation and assembly module TamA
MTRARILLHALVARDALWAGAAGILIGSALGVVIGVGAAHAQPAVQPLEFKGDRLESALEAKLRAATPARSPPRTRFEAERQSAEAAALARALLREEGYFAAESTPAPTLAPTLRAGVAVRLGQRFVFGAVRADSTGEASPAITTALTVGAARLKPGAPARAEDVLAAEAAIVSDLRAAGYPDAVAGPRDVEVDHATGAMRVLFTINPGQQALIGVLRAQPPTVLDQGVLDRIAQVTPGAVFTPAPLEGLRADLLATGVFSRVGVSLAPPAPGSNRRDVVVEFEPAPRRVLEAGAGWSTADGLGVEAAWTTRNLTARADTRTLAAALSEQRQKITADWVLPFGGGRDRAWRFGAALERDIAGPFERVGVRLSGAQEAKARRDLGFSLGASVSADVFTRSQGVEQAIVLAGLADVRRDDTDDPLDAREGAILEARLEPSVSFGDATTGFIRATAQARGYLSFDPDRRWTVAGRLRGGWVAPTFGRTDDIPPDRLFYAGGGGSVRGYAFNSIFPDGAAQGRAAGGRGLFETGLELRGRFDDRLGAAVFVDGASAFNDGGEMGDAFRWGAGVGLRYDLGFGPLRLDIATPLNRRGGDAPISVYVSIGQAF